MCIYINIFIYLYKLPFFFLCARLSFFFSSERGWLYQNWKMQPHAQQLDKPLHNMPSDNVATVATRMPVLGMSWQFRAWLEQTQPTAVAQYNGPRSLAFNKCWRSVLAANHTHTRWMAFARQQTIPTPGGWRSQSTSMALLHFWHGMVQLGDFTGQPVSTHLIAWA